MENCTTVWTLEEENAGKECKMKYYKQNKPAWMRTVNLIICYQKYDKEGKKTYLMNKILK
jgi:hypothetical protein